MATTACSFWFNMPDDKYEQVKPAGTGDVTKLQIFPVLDKVRRIARSAALGYNVLRYLKDLYLTLPVPYRH